MSVERRSGRATRRLGQRIALVVVALLGASALVAAPARATVYDDGTIALGTQVTMTGLGTDGFVYRLALPAGQRLVISTADSPAPTAAGVYILDDALNKLLTNGYVGNDGTLRGTTVELPPASTDRAIRLQFGLNATGELPFTAHGVNDLPTQPIEWDTPTTVTLGAYQQAALTFAGVAGKRLIVEIPESSFAASGLAIDVETPHPYLGVMQRAYPVIPPSPSQVMTAQPYQLRIDGVGAASGSVTIRIRQIADVGGTLTLGEVTTATIDTVWTQVHQTFTQVAGARLKFEVLSSSLQHADKTPGSARATYTARQGYGTTEILLGNITNAPLVGWSEAVMPAGTTTFSIVPDGASTGTITYRLSAEPDNPPVAAALGTPIAVDLSQLYKTRTYTFDTPPGQRFTIELSGLAISAADPANARVAVTLADSVSGTTAIVGEVTPDTPTLSRMYTAQAQTSWTLTLDPYADTTGSLNVLIRLVEDAMVPLTAGQVTTGTMPPGGGDLIFTAPGSTTPGLPAITVEGSTLVDAAGGHLGAWFTFEQEGLGYSPSYFDWIGTTTRYSFRAPDGLDPARPWRLRVNGAPGASVSMPPGATGSISVSLRPPTLTKATIALGATKRVTFEGVADATELTFRPQVGKRIVVQLSNVGAPAGYELRTVSGTVLQPVDENEFEARTTTEPLVLALRQGETGNAGSVDVVVRQVSDPVLRANGATTVRWGIGQNPKLVFDGEKGRRVSLALEAGDWQPADRPVTATLLDARGTALGSFDTYYGGNQFTSSDFRLPADGRYTVQFDPSGPTAGSLVATVKTVKDLQRTVALGSTTQLEFTQPGQRAYLTVKVPAGTQLAWSIPSATMVATMTLLDSSDAPVGFAYLGMPDLSGTLSFEPLPAGTYTVVVGPSSPPTGKLRLTLMAA